MSRFPALAAIVLWTAALSNDGAVGQDRRGNVTMPPASQRRSMGNLHSQARAAAAPSARQTAPMHRRWSYGNRPYYRKPWAYGKAPYYPRPPVRFSPYFVIPQPYAAYRPYYVYPVPYVYRPIYPYFIW